MRARLQWFVAPLLMIFAADSARGASSPRLDPRDSSLAIPAMGGDADAEIVEWRVRVVDSVPAQGFDRMIEQYRATMVYTARGAEAEGTASLAYGDNTTIEFVRIAVTGPDGTRRVLSADQGVDQLVLRGGRFQLRERRFALPGVVPGSLVEMESRIRALDTRYLRDFFHLVSQDVPIRHFVFWLKPWRDSPPRLMTNQPALLAIPPARDPDGFWRLEKRHIPAFTEEPHAPAVQREVIALWARYGVSGVPARYQRFLAGSEWGRTLESTLPVTDTVRVRAREVVGEAVTLSDQLARLHEYCRQQIALASDGPGLADRIPRQGLDDRPERTLRDRVSNRDGVNFAMAAMARALGLDVRLAFVNDPILTSFLGDRVDAADHALVAMRVGGRVRLYDPGARVLPPGIAAAEDEGETIFLVGGGPPPLGVVTRAEAEESRTERHLVGVVDAEGSLSGRLRVRVTGHALAEHRLALRTAAGTESRRTALAAELARDLPTATIGPIEFSEDPDEGMAASWSCTLDVPNYLTIVNGRGLTSASPLPQLGDVLPASGPRRRPLSWRYASVRSDSVSLRLPAGWQVVRTPSISPVKFQEVFSATATFEHTAGGDWRYSSHCRFDHGPTSGVPAQYVAELKQAVEVARAYPAGQVEVVVPDAGSR